MNENMQEFLFSVASVFILILALIVFLTIDRETKSLNEVMDKSIASERSFYESKTESDATYVTGAQIIYSIKTGLTCDFEIDGFFIMKDVDLNVFDYTIIDANRTYSVINLINSSGEIIQVTYKKK